MRACASCGKENTKPFPSYHSLPFRGTNYMVSGSQNAACFSNRGEFILRVFSQGFVSDWVLFLTLLNPAIYFFFLNFFVSDFHVFVSHAFQDLSSISIDFIWSSGRCPRSVQPLFDQCVDLGVKLGSHISLHLAKETGSIGDGYIVFPRPGTNAGEWCAMEGT